MPNNNKDWVICLNYWVKHSKEIVLMQSKLKLGIISEKKKKNPNQESQQNT